MSRVVKLLCSYKGTKIKGQDGNVRFEATTEKDAMELHFFIFSQYFKGDAYGIYPYFDYPAVLEDKILIKV